VCDGPIQRDARRGFDLIGRTRPLLGIRQDRQIPEEATPCTSRFLDGFDTLGIMLFQSVPVRFRLARAGISPNP